MNDALILKSDECPPAREFASTNRYPSDVALLNYLLQDLRVLARRGAKDEITISPHEPMRWQVHGLKRLTIVCDPATLLHAKPVRFVGFFGDRRADSNEALVNQYELELHEEFKVYPGILSYSSSELVDHYWANLVIHQRAEDRELWRESPVHQKTVSDIAPHAYHSVRIHNGSIADGVTGSSTVDIQSTKYWDYDVDPVWHARRTLANNGWTRG